MRRLPELGFSAGRADGRRLLRLLRCVGADQRQHGVRPARCWPRRMSRRRRAATSIRFAGHRFMRFSYAGSHDDMVAATDRIGQWLRSLTLTIARGIWKTGAMPRFSSLRVRTLRKSPCAATSRPSWACFRRPDPAVDATTGCIGAASSLAGLRRDGRGLFDRRRSAPALRLAPTSGSARCRGVVVRGLGNRLGRRICARRPTPPPQASAAASSAAITFLVRRGARCGLALAAASGFRQRRAVSRFDRGNLVGRGHGFGGIDLRPAVDFRRRCRRPPLPVRLLRTVALAAALAAPPLLAVGLAGRSLGRRAGSMASAPSSGPSSSPVSGS